LDQASSMIQQANGAPLPKALSDALELVQLDAMREADSATPDADKNFDAALNTAIDAITKDVEPLIKNGKATTAAQQDKVLGTLSDRGTSATESQKKTTNLDNEWVQCIAEQQEALALVEKRDQELADATKARETSCAYAVSLKGFEETPEFGELSVNCDVSVSGMCDGEVQKLETSVDKTIADTQAKLDAATKKYNDAYAICVTDTNTETKAVADQQSATDAFNTKVQGCNQMQASDDEAQCSFGMKYYDYCLQLVEVNSFMGEMDAVGNPYSNPDRRSEWKSVRGLKCTLQQVIDGVALDDALVTSCNGKADTSYESEVGDVVKDTARLGQIVGGSYTCQETEITFSGFNWSIPADAKSTDYKKEAYSPAVQRSDANVKSAGVSEGTFEFCQ